MNLFLSVFCYYNLLQTWMRCLSWMKNWTRASSSLIRCTLHRARLSLRAASSDRRLYWAISSFLQFEYRNTHVASELLSWGSHSVQLEVNACIVKCHAHGDGTDGCRGANWQPLISDTVPFPPPTKPYSYEVALLLLASLVSIHKHEDYPPKYRLADVIFAEMS